MNEFLSAGWGYLVAGLAAGGFSLVNFISYLIK